MNPHYLKTFDYFLKLEPALDHFGHSPAEDSRPDVEELYEVVKRHHEAEERDQESYLFNVVHDFLWAP